MGSIDVIPVFLAAIDTGSIQGAARELNMARPTVRRRLEGLEAEVGVTLLVRGRRGLQPTVAGEVFAQRARQMLFDFEALSHAARAAGASPRGVLRVGVPAGIPTPIVVGMHDSVRAMWPDVRLELHSATSNEDLLGRVDCRFALELDPPGDTMEVVELGVIREQLVASPNYLAGHSPIESVSDLSGHRLFAWVAPDSGSPTRLPVVSGLAPRVEIAMATNDLASLVWLAVHDRGLVFMPFEPALARAPFIDGGELVPVLPDIVGRDRPRRLVVSKALAGSPVVAAFVEQTRSIAKALLGV